MCDECGNPHDEPENSEMTVQQCLCDKCYNDTSHARGYCEHCLKNNCQQDTAQDYEEQLIAIAEFIGNDGVLDKNNWDAFMKTFAVQDPCVHCGVSTVMGQGSFVNRLPTDGGYACAECAGYNCDICEKQIYLDSDITDKQESGHYHTWCLPMEEWHEGAISWFSELDLETQDSYLAKPKEKE